MRWASFITKNKLKRLYRETIQINPKYLPIQTGETISTFFFRMKISLLALENLTGVIFVVYTLPERKDDLYQRVDACIANGGIEAFYDYLLKSVDLDGFAVFLAHR